MHHEGQDSAGQAPFGLDEAAGHHDNQDDANAEGGARRQGLDQTMHGCRRKGYWVSARIWGDWVECFHNRPSIPNPSTESYSNGKTRVTIIVLEMVPLVFQGVERLMFDAPPCST